MILDESVRSWSSKRSRIVLHKGQVVPGGRPGWQLRSRTDNVFCESYKKNRSKRKYPILLLPQANRLSEGSKKSEMFNNLSSIVQMNKEK